MLSTSNQLDYGIDAPGLCRFFFLAGAAASALAVFSAIALSAYAPWVSF